MPTLLIYEGFKFFFYANEHEPKHIHVMKGGDFENWVRSCILHLYRLLVQAVTNKNLR